MGQRFFLKMISVPLKKNMGVLLSALSTFWASQITYPIIGGAYGGNYAIEDDKGNNPFPMKSTVWALNDRGIVAS